MPVTRSVPYDLCIELLERIVARDGTRYDVCAAILSLEDDLIGANGILVPVGHEPLAHHELCILFQGGDCLSLGIVHTLDLYHLHRHLGAIVEICLGHRIQDALALACARAVMLFHIAHLRALFQKESMHAVVLGIRRTAVIDTTPRDDEDVSPFSDVKVVVDDLFEAALREYDGDMDALVLSTRKDLNIDTADILFGSDDDMLGGSATDRLGVRTDIISPFGDAVEICDLVQ